MKSNLERKFPLQFERARLLTKCELERGVEFYTRGGGFTHEVWNDEKGKR